MVFATGIMLQDEHLEDLGQQTIYGIWDRQTIDGTMLAGESFTPVSDTQLEERTVIPASRASNGSFFYYAISGDAIDLLTLARNARTSVEMIDRFYAKHLTAEMNVEQLHGGKLAFVE